MAVRKNKPGLVKQFLGHVMPGIVKPMHALWNEIIGFFFIVLAVGFGASAFRSFRTASHDSESLVKLLISVGFALWMAYFGVSSFLKARRISRS